MAGVRRIHGTASERLAIARRALAEATKKPLATDTCHDQPPPGNPSTQRSNDQMTGNDQETQHGTRLVERVEVTA